MVRATLPDEGAIAAVSVELPQPQAIACLLVPRSRQATRQIARDRSSQESSRRPSMGRFQGERADTSGLQVCNSVVIGMVR